LDDGVLARKVALSFVAKLPQYLAALKAGLAKGNANDFQRQAQMLKEAAVNLGADKIAALAAELVELGRCDELFKAGHALKPLNEEFDCLERVLAGRGWIGHRGLLKGEAFPVLSNTGKACIQTE
jgi:HPt (histidine-containing phosphotransfer) domain-containing protein